MPNIFEQSQFQKPKMSAFDLSRQRKLSCDMGELIPVYLEEIIPGDQFRVKTEAMVRMAPMIAPIMHQIDVYMHYFYVPNRIVWNEWEDFITGGQDGLAAPEKPTIPLNNEMLQWRLADYLGIPPELVTSPTDVPISALPFRMYHEIWNEYYRDPNLHDPIDVHTASDADLSWLRHRCWEKDYFTSALPFRQRGDDVGINIEPDYKEVSEYYNIDGSTPPTGVVTMNDPGSGLAGQLLDDNSQTTRVENLDLDSLNVNINDLRRSSAIQRWLEKSAIGGYRYIEQLAAQFGVESSDARLQRPEYLGGGKQPVAISEVLNTSATADQPQGDMAGHGISTGATNTFQKTFEEHGYVMGILSILPKPAYQQGIHRHWSREDKFDYAWPDLANLGLQEVKNKELYADITDDEYNEGTFGYQQRYAEYKYGVSQVNGDFRTSLDHWHAGRIFGDKPALNPTFVEMDAQEIDNRIFAAPEEQNFWIQMHHSVKARRPLPYFADPRLT